MIRRLYLMTLLALQLALLMRVAPRLGHALHVDAAISALPGGWPAAAQLVIAAVAVIGVALALVFPGVAWLRHCQRGETRFRGLPRWAVKLTLAGAAAAAGGLLLLGLPPLLPADLQIAVVLVAGPAQNAGLALMAAGALCAELLRRSVGAPSTLPPPRRIRAERIEVTDPPELRTRGA
jgi:hypothetical protein